MSLAARPLRGPTHIEQKVKGLFFKKLILTYICCHRLNCDYSLGGVMGSVLMCIFSVD